MKNREKSVTILTAAALVAGAADLVIHSENIRRSMRGQQQHYATRERSALSRFAHALAAQTVTGRVVSAAIRQLPSPSKAQESEDSGR